MPLGNSPAKPKEDLFKNYPKIIHFEEKKLKALPQKLEQSF
jgi:hypothetical protein